MGLAVRRVRCIGIAVADGDVGNAGRRVRRGGPRWCRAVAIVGVNGTRESKREPLAAASRTTGPGVRCPRQDAESAYRELKPAQTPWSPEAIAAAASVDWQTTFMERNATGDVRVWAKSQGLPVGDRGRLPAAVIEAYQATFRVDPATPARGMARTPATRPKRPAAPAAQPTPVPVKQAKPAKRASRHTPAPTRRSVVPAEQPSLADLVRRVAALEAQLVALTKRLDATVAATKPSRGFSLPRLR